MEIILILFILGILGFWLFKRWERNSDINRVRQLAKAGKSWAQFEMGSLHQYGNRVPKNLSLAVSYYRKAAEQGHIDAQSNLGVLYAQGQGVLRDYEEAFRWFSMAADKGNAFSQNNLCNLYAFGQGVPQDYVEAYKWLELAISGLEGAQKEKAKMNRDMFLASHMDEKEIRKAKKIVAEWKSSH